jgi:hypothetical protein
MVHLVITTLVVSATGHHWWLDGIVALALLWVALQLDTLGRRWVRTLRGGPLPVSADVAVVEAAESEVV